MSKMTLNYAFEDQRMLRKTRSDPEVHIGLTTRLPELMPGNEKTGLMTNVQLPPLTPVRRERLRTVRRLPSFESQVDNSNGEKTSTLGGKVGTRRARSEQSSDSPFLQLAETCDFLIQNQAKAQALEGTEKPRKVRRIHSDISQDIAFLKQEGYKLLKQWAELENLTKNQKHRTEAVKPRVSAPASPAVSSPGMVPPNQERLWCRQCGISEAEAPNVEWVSGPQGPETLCHCCGWLFNHKISKQNELLMIFSQLYPQDY